MFRLFPSTLAALLILTTPALAQYYYDTNGATPGFGDSWSNTSASPEPWDLNTTAHWTTSAAGDTATSTWQSITGLNGSTTTLVDNNVVFNPPAAARVAVGDQNAGANFIIDFGSHDLIRQGGSGTLRLQNPSPTADRNGILRFGGGEINVSDGTLAIGGPQVSGSFIKTGSALLEITSTAETGGNGLTNVVVDTGTLKLGGTTGNYAVNSGTSIQNNGTLQVARDFTVGQLTGNGAITQAGISTSNFTMTIDASVNQTFGGSTPPGTRTLNIVKDGSASVTLSSNSLQHIGTTTVSNGLLSITGTHTGGGTYTVQNGGTLGGDGSIGTNNANVTVEAGGKLAPGTSPGTLTFALGTGELDLSAIGTGDLQFEMGPTSDMVVLSTGILNIGTLDFDEFDFTALGGLAEGDYLLFDSNETIVGSIGEASGIFDGIYQGTLSLINGGQDLNLNIVIVPEPSAMAMVLVAGIGLAVLRRRSRR